MLFAIATRIALGSSLQPDTGARESWRVI
jgi:hypothetical protein